TEDGTVRTSNHDRTSPRGCLLPCRFCCIMATRTSLHRLRMSSCTPTPFRVLAYAVWHVGTINSTTTCRKSPATFASSTRPTPAPSVRDRTVVTFNERAAAALRRVRKGPHSNLASSAALGPRLTSPASPYGYR